MRGRNETISFDVHYDEVWSILVQKYWRFFLLPIISPVPAGIHGLLCFNQA